MADDMTVEQRSYTMSRIRSRGNATTEAKLIKILKERGVSGWQQNSDLPGRPDLVFAAERAAIFVDGCFWHGCSSCKLQPKSNAEYWDKKIGGNRLRDRKVRREIAQQGWVVLRIWEHSLARPATVPSRIRRTLRAQYQLARNATPLRYEGPSFERGFEYMQAAEPQEQYGEKVDAKNRASTDVTTLETAKQ
jgi:DNA mismatch endonuclease, patch repair protein